MNDQSYFVIKAVGLARENEDDFAQACFELGADGVAEDLSFEQQDLKYEPSIVETPILNMHVYFQRAPNKEQYDQFVLFCSERFSEAQLELVVEKNKDWLAEWKKGFKPFCFASPFWIIPSWLTPPEDAPKDARYLIYVEPGMAFGTGTHETTRLAAQFLIQEVQTYAPESLLDVGTGTGILALVASRLGVKKVVGIDNDQEARRTARENLEKNEAREIEIPNIDLSDINDTFDFVVANIIDGVLLLLRTDLIRVLKPGGTLILSGILSDRQSTFLSEFLAHHKSDLELVEIKSEKEWTAAVLRKK